MREIQTTGKRRKHGAPVVFCLFLALCVFLWRAPGPLLAQLERDVFGEQLEIRARQRYHGVITVWQIDGFEGGKGSRTAWLNARFSAIERRNNGIFLAVKSMTPEQARAALASGSTLPDLISYGSGMLENTDLFLDLPPDLFASVAPNLAAAGEGKALPWCFGAYCVLASQEAAAHDTGGTLRAETLPILLEKAGGQVSGKKTRTRFALGIPDNGLTPEAALAAEVPGGCAGGAYSLRRGGSPEQLWDAYCSAGISMLLGTQRDLCRLESAVARGKPVRATQMLPLTACTDLVQCVSVLKNEDPLELQVIWSVLRYLLSTDVQASLSEIGLFPVSVAAAQTVHYEDENLAALFRAVWAREPFVPGVFQPAEQRRTDADALAEYLKNGKNSATLLRYRNKTG